MNFEIGRSHQHSICRHAGFSATGLGTPTERGGNGLGDTFDECGFEDFAVGHRKIIFFEAGGRRRCGGGAIGQRGDCLLYTSPSARREQCALNQKPVGGK